MRRLHLFDFEATLCQEGWNVTCEVTTFKRPAAEWFQPLLPASDIRID